MQFVWISMMQELSFPPRSSFIVVRSYSQSILRLGGLRSVLSKMYSFMQCFYWIEVYNLVVLCYFEDIMKACNFWTEDTVLYALGSVSTVHKACFSCSMQQLNQLSTGAQCLSVLITKSCSILFWSLTVKSNILIFSFLHWGSTQSTNKREEEIASKTI